MPLNVIIITQGLSPIVAPIAQKHKIIGIIEAAPRKSIKKSFLYCFFYNVYHFFKGTVSLPSFAKRNNIPYYYMSNGSDINLENWVGELKPDIIVVYSMSQLLKENIFTLPVYGTINLHPSLLPKYRGPNPCFWMYCDLDLNPGVTIHYIDKGEDTGDIIYQETYDIPLGMKFSDIKNIAIDKIGVNLLLKALDDIPRGVAPHIPQPKTSPTPRARNINPKEHVIDWDNWPIERIWHVLRGTGTWLNALAEPNGFYWGQEWTISEFEKCKINNYHISQIYKEHSRYFVACNEGKIYLDISFSLKKIIQSIIN